MSDIKKLLESIDRFAGQPEQKPGDQVRGTDKATKENPFKHRLVGEDDEYCDACDRVKTKCVCDDELKESLMTEYKYFVEQTPPAANVAPAGNSTSPTPTQTAAGGAPGPGGQAQPAPAGQAQPATGTAPATPVKPGQPAPAGQAQPATGTAPAKPGQPATGAGTATPPNPQKVKQDTDAITGVLNNPAHPMNAELQAMLKKLASMPK